MPIMQFIGNLGYVVVAILGGFLTIKKTIEVGDIQSFIQYVRSFTQPIQQIAQVANMLQMTAAASERVFEFLEEEEEDQTVEHPVSVENLEGNVSFDHVHFGYNADRIIVNDFSARSKRGAENCNCRTDRSRKDNDDQASDAILRCKQRCDQD